MPRYSRAQMAADLERSTVFVSGSRHVGKTTLALSLPGAPDELEALMRLSGFPFPWFERSDDAARR